MSGWDEFVKWWWNEDRAWNANTGGKEGVTLSETWARWRKDGNRFQRTWGWGACGFLNIFQRGHCDKVLAKADQREKDKGPKTDKDYPA